MIVREHAKTGGNSEGPHVHEAEQNQPMVQSLFISVLGGARSGGAEKSGEKNSTGGSSLA